MIHYKSGREIERMAIAGEMVAQTFQQIAPLVVAGTSTQEIDDAVRDMVQALGGKPLFLGYNGFPAHCCISVNDEVVHGIPGPGCWSRVTWSVSILASRWKGSAVILRVLF